MENNDQNLNNQVNTNNSNANQPTQNNTNKIVFALMALIIVGLAGYIVYTKFIQKDDKSEPKSSNTQEQENNNSQDGNSNTQEQEVKTNANYAVLNYQCKNEYCDGEDRINVKQLLKTNDTVKTIYDDKNHKHHVILLENNNGNVYLYLVDEDKYYFKDNNYHQVEIINGGYEDDTYIYDYNYAIVHQHITKHYENTDYNTSNSKIYDLKNGKYVFEADEYYDFSYAEYENQRFYILKDNGDRTLYDNNFNKVFDVDTYGDFAFDGQYVFGIIEQNSKYKFFRYNITTKKYELSNVVFGNSNDWEDFDFTYNYIVKENGDEFEIYDFDGNIVFKTDEKTNLKNIKTKDYVMPFLPKVYYSKAKNKIKLMIEPDICGDSSCPPHFGYSYYEYDISSKKVTYKFYTDSIPDSIYQNLYDGYVETSY